MPRNEHKRDPAAANTGEPGTGTGTGTLTGTATPSQAETKLGTPPETVSVIIPSTLPELIRLGLENTRLTSEIRRLHAENSRLTGEMERMCQFSGDLTEARVELAEKARRVMQMRGELAVLRAEVARLSDTNGEVQLGAARGSAELSLELGRVRGELADAVAAKIAAEGRVVELEAEGTRAREEVAVVREEMTSVKEELRSAEADNGRLLAVNRRSAEEVAALRVELDSVKKQLQEAQALQARLETTNGQLTHHISCMITQLSQEATALAAAKSASAEATAAADKRVLQAQEEMARSDGELAMVREELARLRAELHSAKAENVQLQEMNTRAAAELDAAMTSVAATNTRIGVLHAEGRRSTEEIAAVRAELDAARNQLQTVQADYEIEKSELSKDVARSAQRLKTMALTAVAARQSSSITVLELRVELHTITSKNKELEAENKTTKANLAAANVELDKIKSEKEGLQSTTPPVNGSGATSSSGAPTERRKLNIAPRTAPIVREEAASPQPAPAREVEKPAADTPPTKTKPGVYRPGALSGRRLQAERPESPAPGKEEKDRLKLSVANDELCAAKAKNEELQAENSVNASKLAAANDELRAIRSEHEGLLAEDRETASSLLATRYELRTAKKELEELQGRNRDISSLLDLLDKQQLEELKRLRRAMKEDIGVRCHPRRINEELEQTKKSQKITEELRKSQEEKKRLEGEIRMENMARKIEEDARARIEQEVWLRQEAEKNLVEGIPPIKYPTGNQIAEKRASLGYQEGFLHIAITGCSGVGKSSLINAVRGYRNREIRFSAFTSLATHLAPTGVSDREIATKIERYVDPHHLRRHLAWYDVPGAGTIHVRDWQYFNDQGLYIFDIIMIAVGDRITKRDVDLLFHSKRFGIPTLFVRSKADLYIRNMAGDDEVDEHEARRQYVEFTRAAFNNVLIEMGLPPQKIYIVSKETLRLFIGGKRPKPESIIDEEELMRDITDALHKWSTPVPTDR